MSGPLHVTRVSTAGEDGPPSLLRESGITHASFAQVVCVSRASCRMVPACPVGQLMDPTRRTPSRSTAFRKGIGRDEYVTHNLHDYARGPARLGEQPHVHQADQPPV